MRHHLLRHSRLVWCLILLSDIPLHAAWSLQPVRDARGTSDTVLTGAALTQLTNFWTAFLRATDSIRRPSEAQFMTPIGTPTSLLALDTVYSGTRIDRLELVQHMSALATKYASVAATLQHAGLTSDRYQALFQALLNTCRTFNGMTWGNPVVPTPRQSQNIAFLKAHHQLLDSLVASAGAEQSMLLGSVPIWGTGDCGRMAYVLRSADTTPLPSVATDSTPVIPTSGPSLSEPTHLTVHPARMARGAKNTTAGVSVVDSNPSVYVYVPSRAVGIRRVPLVLLLHGSGGSALELVTDFQQFADSMGFLLLAIQSTDPDGWSFSMNNTVRTPDEQNIDHALQRVLARYRVDPARIALFGFSAGAGMALDLGYVNGDIFSRIVAFSPPLRPTEFDALPRSGRPAIFIGYGMEEGNASVLQAAARWLSKRGDTTVYREFPGGHELDEVRASAGLAWLMSKW